MNSEVRRVTALKPVEAIKKKQTIAVSKPGQPDLTLMNKTVRYLYQPGEVANDTNS